MRRAGGKQVGGRPWRGEWEAHRSVIDIRQAPAPLKVVSKESGQTGGWVGGDARLWKEGLHGKRAGAKQVMGGGGWGGRGANSWGRKRSCQSKQDQPVVLSHAAQVVYYFETVTGSPTWLLISVFLSGTNICTVSCMLSRSIAPAVYASVSKHTPQRVMRMWVVLTTRTPCDTLVDSHCPLTGCCGWQPDFLQASKGLS
jgi:hypothetical protein